MSAVLALVGVMPGLARLLVELAGDPAATSRPEAASQLPVLSHVISGMGFAVLGAFQFATAGRRSRRGWHRRTGRIIAPLGVTAALSGMWLALFYGGLRHTGELLTVLRLTFGAAMAAAIVMGFVAAIRRDIAGHLAWMTRGYALGLGASTQIFTLGFGGAVFGTGEVATAMLNGAGWAVNLTVAEWVIRRRRPAGRRLVRPSVLPAQR